MATPFIAEIRIFPYNFAPRNWAFCNGQLMSISQNTALFSLIGTTYGGNGQTTFAVPNLQGTGAIGFGQGPGLSPRSLGEMTGSFSTTLLQTEIPAHGHAPQANSGFGDQKSPANSIWAKAHVGRATDLMYAATGGGSPMNAGAIGSAGGSQPHNNLQPYLVLNFCIALYGVFPPRQ